MQSLHYCFEMVAVRLGSARSIGHFPSLFHSVLNTDVLALLWCIEPVVVTHTAVEFERLANVGSRVVEVFQYFAAAFGVLPNVCAN